jgi:hypothetical protein
LSAVGPLAIRALVAIGFVSVSFAGVTTAFNGLITYAQFQWSSLPFAVLQLSSLAGVPAALGLIFGAGLARITLWAAANGTKLIFKGA